MSLPQVEIQRVSENCRVWSRYDHSVKAELFSTALTTESGVVLIDPIDPALSGEIAEAGAVAAIIVTNENHQRAALAFALHFDVPIYGARLSEIPSAIVIHEDGPLLPGLAVSCIEGAAPGELALFCAADGGTLVIGDAVINFGGHGFTFLPAKYCSNQKLMRKSLRKLLDFDFERILFAHGTPIVSKARQRLATLLEEAS